MNFRIAAVAILLFVIAAPAIWLGNTWWVQRQWFALQRKQMATIKRLEAFPPRGTPRNEWREAITGVHNVWGNVIFAPSHSQISNAEMEALQDSLEQILNQTTPDNSIQSVDRIYGMLMGRSRNTRFVPGYREEFRAQFAVPVEAASQR